MLICWKPESSPLPISIVMDVHPEDRTTRGVGLQNLEECHSDDRISPMKSDRSQPKLALCNFIPDIRKLRELALSLGFEGVDWTFTLEDLPRDAREESSLCRRISDLLPLETRYHCAFNGIDLGDADPVKASEAIEVFQRACRIVSRLNGRYVTIHMGLGRADMNGILWERSIDALKALVEFAQDLGICVCLENLAGGWSSRPELFERLIRKTGAGITLDIGHAQICESVQTQGYFFEDFALPNLEKVHNAHIYHEEHNGCHLPPKDLSDLCERLCFLICLPCNWWVLELREEASLRATHAAVNEFIQKKPEHPPKDLFGIP